MTKNELINLINEGLSTRDIAKKVNKSQSTIRYFLKKFNLKTSPKHKSGPKSPLQTNNGLAIKERNWIEIQNFYNLNNSWREVAKKFKICDATIFKAVKMGLLTSRTRGEYSKIGALKHKGKKLTDAQKEKVSIGRKKFLKENPDKHPWRKNNKFKSVPCEKVKEWLTSKAINFVEEYNPLINDRNFSIDIAFPDKMIGLEINGNQHYNRDGTLKPYYLERQTLMESKGWKIYQLHYSLCFKIEGLEKLIYSILSI
jgi:transposase